MATPCKRQYTGWAETKPAISSAKSNGPVFYKSSDVTPYITTDTESVFTKHSHGNSTMTFSQCSNSDLNADPTCHRNNPQRVLSVPGTASFSHKGTSIGSSRNMETVGRPAQSCQIQNDKTPFTRQMPSFNNETPIVLATAKYIGSKIQTSCNTESIKQLQNPYKACSSVSSEYFSNRKTSQTPLSVSREAASVRSSSSEIKESEDISESNIKQIRSTSLGDVSSINDSQVVQIFLINIVTSIVRILVFAMQNFLGFFLFIIKYRVI